MTDFGHYFSAGALPPLPPLSALRHDKPQLPLSPTLPYSFFMPPLPPLQNLHLARFHPYLTSQMLLRQQAAAAAAQATRVTSQGEKKSMQRKRASSVTVLDLSLPKSSDAQQSFTSNCDVRRTSIDAAKTDADVTPLCWRVTQQNRSERSDETERGGAFATMSCGSASPPLTPTTPSMPFKKNMLKRFREYSSSVSSRKIRKYLLFVVLSENFHIFAK